MWIGISSFAFGWSVEYGAPPLDESALLAFAFRQGAEVVQLGDNLPVHTMDNERRAKLRNAADAAGLELELGARGLTDEQLRTYLCLCRELGARLLRFVADQGDYEPSPAYLTALLRNATREIESSGVRLGIENHDRFTATTLRRIVDDVATPSVGVCLDTANSFGAGEGLSQVAGVLAPVTVNLHVKDVAIQRVPNQMGFTIEGRPLGRGHLPIRAALDLVIAGGNCRSAIVELWTPPESTMEQTLAKEAAWAVQSLDYLKRLLSPAMVP